MTGNMAILITVASVAVVSVVAIKLYHRWLLRRMKWVSPDTLKVTAKALSCGECRHMKVIDSGLFKVMWCKRYKDALDYRFGQAIRVKGCNGVVK